MQDDHLGIEVDPSAVTSWAFEKVDTLRYHINLVLQILKNTSPESQKIDCLLIDHDNYSQLINDQDYILRASVHVVIQTFFVIHKCMRLTNHKCMLL